MIYLNIALVVLLVVYWFYTRRLIRRILNVNIALQSAGNKIQNELNILTDQYRQLANINQALRDVKKAKKGKNK